MANDLPALAEQVATKAHKGQKYGDQPYTDHLAEVAAIVRGFGYGGSPGAGEAVGWLHDALEDTDLTRADLESTFGEAIAHAVLFCTDEEGHNRKTKKRLTFHRMRGQLDTWVEHGRVPDFRLLGLRVKLADRIANIRASLRDDNKGLLKMYQKEQPAFREALVVQDTADAMWAEIDRLLA